MGGRIRCAVVTDWYAIAKAITCRDSSLLDPCSGLWVEPLGSKPLNHETLTQEH